jgi:hypothetical protein
MIKLVDLLKEITLLEYNKSQLDYIAIKLNIEDRNKFNSLMNALDSQGIKYPDLKKQIEDGSLKTIKDLELLKTVSNKDKIKIEKTSGSKKLFENNHFLIVEPLSVKSSCIYGAGTKWCTTGDDAKEFFRNYTSNGGRLIYIIDKTKSEKDPDYKMAYSYIIENSHIPIGKDNGKNIWSTAKSHIPKLFNAIDDELSYNSIEFKEYFKYMQNNGVPIDKIFPIQLKQFIFKNDEEEKKYKEFKKQHNALRYN